MKQLVKADDEKLGRVAIAQQNLVHAERILEQNGLGETTMSKNAHHLLAGGLAYLISHPKDPVSINAASQLVKRSRSALGVLAKSIGKAEGVADNGATKLR